MNPDRLWPDALAAEAIRRLTDFEPKNLANTAWSFSTLAVYHVPLLDAIASSSTALITLF